MNNLLHRQEGIRSLYVQLPPAEAKRQVEAGNLTEVCELSKRSHYDLEYIPSQGGCVVALIPQERQTEGASALIEPVRRAFSLATTWGRVTDRES